MCDNIRKNVNEFRTYIPLKVINIFEVILNLKSILSCSLSKILFIDDLYILMKRIVLINDKLYLHDDKYNSQ